LGDVYGRAEEENTRRSNLLIAHYGKEAKEKGVSPPIPLFFFFPFFIWRVLGKDKSGSCSWRYHREMLRIKHLPEMEIFVAGVFSTWWILGSQTL